jgi:hypothetical protein
MADPKPVRYKDFVIRYNRGEWYVDDPKESDIMKRTLACVWSKKDGMRWVDTVLKQAASVTHGKTLA